MAYRGEETYKKGLLDLWNDLYEITRTLRSNTFKQADEDTKNRVLDTLNARADQLNLSINYWDDRVDRYPFRYRVKFTPQDVKGVKYWLQCWIFLDRRGQPYSPKCGWRERANPITTRDLTEMVLLLRGVYRYVKEKILEQRPAKEGVEITFVISIHYAGSQKRKARNLEAHFKSIAPKNDAVLKLVAEKVRRVMESYLKEHGYSEDDLPMEFGFDYDTEVREGKQITLDPSKTLPSVLEIYDYDYSKDRYPKPTNLPFGWWRLRPEEILEYF